MTLDEAYQILGISRASSEAERHTAFHAKQDALQGKLETAPTPGLKAKYQTALQQLETAIELVEESANRELLSSAPTAAVPFTGPVQSAEPVGNGSEVAESSAHGESTASSFGKKIAAILVVVVLMAAGGWWITVEQPRREAEAVRLRVEQELAETQRLEAAAAVREAERQALSELVDVQLKQLRAGLERLEGILTKGNSLRDALKVEMGYSEQDGDGNTVRHQYDSIRWLVLTDYLQWYWELQAVSKVEQPILQAESAIQAGDLEAAVKWTTEGLSLLEPLETEIRHAHYKYYDSALIKWVLRLEKDQDRAIRWLRSDEPELVARATNDLREELSYLDEAPGQSSVLERLAALGLFAGEDDPDYIRWMEQVLPSVIIESIPEGAMVTDADGNELGETPLLGENMLPGYATYRLQLDGYEDAELEVQFLLNGGLSSELVFLDLEVPKPEAGAPWTVDLGEGERLELLYVPAGTFTMGSKAPDADPYYPADAPESYDYFFGQVKTIDPAKAGEKDRDEDEIQHEVTLSDGYWLGRYEVTQGQWFALMGGSLEDQQTKNNSRRWFSGEGSHYPMYFVSWEEAMEFCRKLTERERAARRLPDHLEYTLPSEAQWEYACRAGTQTAYHYGTDLDLSMANYVGTFPDGYEPSEAQYLALLNGMTLPVGSYEGNAWGFFDMHGNVYEWCRDWYSYYYYERSPALDPEGPETSMYHVGRGGSALEPLRECRSAARRALDPSDSDLLAGFRLALRSVR
jgi:formylglycine-generating enzyme required for sulfatase activity